jgi:hypothetical protein
VSADLRFIATQWITQHGPDTPAIVRGWAKDLRNAPTAIRFLEDIADAAEAVLKEGANPPAGDSEGQA